MRQVVGVVVVLALTLASGCSDSDVAPGASSGEGSGESATVQARSLPEIWADVLAQRDRVQKALSKGTDMWHEDCAEVASAAAAFDALAIELSQRTEAQVSDPVRRRGIQDLIGYLQTTVTRLRADAIDETVGALPGLLIGIDALLQGLETHYTREEIGNESVVTRPGFNPFYPPPAPSPV